METSGIQHYPDLNMFVMRVGDDFAKIEYIVKNNCYCKLPIFSTLQK